MTTGFSDPGYLGELDDSYDKDRIANEKLLEEQKKQALLKDRVRGELEKQIASSYYQHEEDEYFKQRPDLLRRNYIWPLDIEIAHAEERQARYNRSIAKAKSDLEDGAADDGDGGDGGEAKDPPSNKTSSASTAKVTSSVSKKSKKPKAPWRGGKQRKSTKQRKSRNQRKRKSTKQRRSMKHRK